MLDPASHTAPRIDASAIIERQRPHAFLIRLLILSIAITFFDGFDMNVIAYAAPYLTEEFSLGRVQMANIFAAGTFGAMVGGFIFGYLGDRYGRRWTIIAAAAGFGVLSVAFAMSRSYHALLVMRFLGGIAIGGLLPLCWALNIEYVPKRFRATVVTVVMLGYTIGAGVGAPITIWLAPKYGWQGVYLFGGIGPLIVTALLIWGLPESIRFLINRGKRPALVASYLKAIEPGLHVPAGATFTLSDEKRAGEPNFTPLRLFEGSLAWVTPLLWIAYVASSVTIYFKSSWTPLVLELLGYTRSQAAAFSSAATIGGAIGGLLIMRLIDKKGPLPIAITSAIAAPILLFVGLTPLGFWSFIILTLIANTAIGGAHFGMHSISGLFYPSSFRANGAGWATSIAKVGSIGGPLVGGYILATKFPVLNIYALLAIAPAILALTLFVLNGRRKRLAEAEAALQAEAAAAVPAS